MHPSDYIFILSIRVGRLGSRYALFEKWLRIAHIMQTACHYPRTNADLIFSISIFKKNVHSGRSSPQYFTDQHLTLTSTAMYLFISSQFGNHTIGFSQSSGLSTIMEFPFSSALLPLLTLLCLLDIGEVSFNVDE